MSKVLREVEGQRETSKRFVCHPVTHCDKVSQKSENTCNMTEIMGTLYFQHLTYENIIVRCLRNYKYKY